MQNRLKATPPPRPSPGETLRVMILAGEMSGDMHAAALMRSIRAKWDGPVEFRGTGGDAMAAEGATLLGHADQMAVIGVLAVLRHAGYFSRLLRRVTDEIKAWRPHVVLTVDYPGFNLRIAARAHAMGFKAVHYICPQVWAWRRGRIPKIARILDRLITILPFEPAYFKDTPLPVTFAGHPLIDRVNESFAEPLADLPWGEGRNRVAILPGSRRGEITRILPDLLAAAARLERDVGDCAFLIPSPTPAMRALAREVIAKAKEKPSKVNFVMGQARQVLRQASAAAVASGTATLEACLMRCPTILVYKVNWLFGKLGRYVILKIPFLGLANIVAGRCVMPELLQEACRPDAIAAGLKTLLTDERRRAAMIADFDSVRRALGDGNAADRAASIVMDEVMQVASNCTATPCADNGTSGQGTVP